jgi:phosphopantetheinyl transferase
MDGRPLPITIDGGQSLIYWSVSHSEDYVAYIVGTTRVGIDIALFRERSESLLDVHKDEEYAILGEKNWNHFYKLWTAKEAIIKSTG